METLQHQVCTVGWVVQLGPSWLFPEKKIPMGEILLGQYSCKKKFFKVLLKEHNHRHWPISLTLCTCLASVLYLQGKHYCVIFSVREHKHGTLPKSAVPLSQDWSQCLFQATALSLQDKYHFSHACICIASSALIEL